MRNFFIALAVTLGFVIFVPHVAFAEAQAVPASTYGGGATYTGSNSGADYTGSNSGATYTGSNSVPNAGSGFSLTNPLNVKTICGLIKKILNVILGLGLPVAVLFMMYAGFLLVASKGKPDKLKGAKENMAHVMIGIGIFLGAWVLGQIIANTINAISPNTVSGTTSCN